MDYQEVLHDVATEFFDELIALNVLLLEAANQNLGIESNFPLFLVPKVGGGNLESIDALLMVNEVDRMMFASSTIRAI